MIGACNPLLVVQASVDELELFFLDKVERTEEAGKENADTLSRKTQNTRSANRNMTWGGWAGYGAKVGFIVRK